MQKLKYSNETFWVIFKQCGTFTQINPNDQFTWLRRSRDRIWDVDVVFNLILRDLLMQPILILNEICRFSNFLKSGLRKSRNHRKRKGTEMNNSKSREIFLNKNETFRKVRNLTGNVEINQATPQKEIYSILSKKSRNFHFFRFQWFLCGFFSSSISVVP